MGIHDYLGDMLDEIRGALCVVDGSQADKLADAITDARAVFVTGAGRSGLAMRSFGMRLVHLGLSAHVVGETTAPRLTDKDLLIVGSGSGATRSLVAHAETARATGAPVAVITAGVDSPIAREADLVLVIPAPSPKVAGGTGAGSMQPLGSLFEQGLLLALDALVLVLMQRTGESPDTMLRRHASLE